eukprot:2340334-Rhodomonas_salina.1
MITETMRVAPSKENKQKKPCSSGPFQQELACCWDERAEHSTMCQVKSDTARCARLSMTSSDVACGSCSIIW